MLIVRIQKEDQRDSVKKTSKSGLDATRRRVRGEPGAISLRQEDSHDSERLELQGFGLAH